MNAVTSAMLIFGKYGVYDKPKDGEKWEFWNIFEDIKAQYVDAFTENKSLERSLKAFAVADELFQKFADVFIVGQQESLELEGVATLAKNVLENSDTTSVSKTAAHVIADLSKQLKDDESCVGRSGNLNSEQIKQELLEGDDDNKSNHSQKGKTSDDGEPGVGDVDAVDEEDILLSSTRWPKTPATLKKRLCCTSIVSCAMPTLPTMPVQEKCSKTFSSRTSDMTWAK